MAAMDLRMVAAVGALGLAAGWALGGRGTVNQPVPPVAVSRGPRPLGVETPATPAPSTHELRRKLERQPDSPRPTRNPFVFAARRPATAEDAAVEIAAPMVPTPGLPAEAAVPTGAAYRLVGVASSGEGETRVRTAVVSGGPSLLLVKTGDALADGWTVAEVQEAAVVLMDGSGGQRVLRLP